MIALLQNRDAKTIAGIQKLRFFPHFVVAGKGCYQIEEDGRHSVTTQKQLPPEANRRRWEHTVTLY